MNWQWLSDLYVSTAIRDSTWGFPILECIHIYSMIFLIALLAAFDMRLMGFAMGQQGRTSIAGLSRLVLRWIWIPVGVNSVTGTLLFAAQASEYSGNWAFVTKMALILVGVLYHLAILLKAARWTEDFAATVQLKLVSVLAVLIWPAVIVASRWIAYA